MFEFNQTQKMAEKMMRGYVEKEILPHVAAMDRGDMLPYDLFRKMHKELGLRIAAEKAINKAIERKRAEEAGETPPEKPEKDKGDEDDLSGGQDPLLMAILMKELSRVSPGFTLSYGASLGLCGSNIQKKGTAEQLEKYAKPIMLYDKIGCWGLTEPDAGSDAFGSMKTVARRDGDYYVINGSKTFITNAPHADIFVIYARLDKGQGGERNSWPVKSFICVREDEGLSTSEPMDKMGMRDSPTGLIYLEDCRIPVDRILGTEEEESRGDGKEVLQGERSGMPAMALGIIERCLEVATKYAKEREQFGQPIANYQAVQLRLADMYIAYENCRNLVFKQAWLQREGKRDMFSAQVAKVYCTQQATKVALDAIQILGGNGYMKEYYIEKLMRDAKLLEIGGGTSDINMMGMMREYLARAG